MIEDGTVLKGIQIISPTKKCEAVSKQFHDGHLGLIKCKLRSNDTVY